MNMEEQILDFLDGNLSGSEEEELLHRLAVSPERRTLLRQHLQVREMVGALAKQQYKQVPIMLTAGVFQAVTALGYTGPQPAHQDVQTAEVAAPAHVVSSSMRRLISLRPASVAIISLLLLLAGGAGTYLMTNSPNTSAVSQTISSAPTQPSDISSKASDVNSTSQNSISRNSISENAQAISPVTSQHASYLHRHSHSVSDNVMANGNSADDIRSNAATTDITNNSTILPEHHDNTTIVKSDVANPSDKNNASSVKGEQNAPADIRDPGMQQSGRKNNPLDGNTLTGGKAGKLPLFEFSVRTGGGKIPGSELGYTGSLVEVRGSYSALDWLSFTVSLGQFMPYETVAIPISNASAGLGRDGSQLLKLAPAVQYRTLASAEVGAHFSLLSMPLEFSVGGGTDFAGTVMPRASLFTSLDLQDNLLLRVGVEGIAYTNTKIGSSLSQAEAQYALDHPLLVGSIKTKETAGFIGPSIELSWRF